MITPDQLRQIMPGAGSRAWIFAGPLSDAMDEYAIDTPRRQAAFFAQLAHESGSLRYTCEIASGRAYEGRADLGNTQPGDGVRFKGRGLIQVTGRANYRACSLALFGDGRLLTDPVQLEQPGPACRSAGWYWQSHALNALADAGDMEQITRRINGGLNGLADRLDFYHRALEVLHA